MRLKSKTLLFYFPTKNSFTLDPAPQRNRTQDNMRHRTSTQRVALSSLDALNKLQAIISGST